MRPLKGGVWTNVEDEILKVAIMKYGRNQWARISSLLVRKTPKQCKARWNEWLDPRIKKTEWSKEEDEKLLHLAKVFPSQWGTISDVVGRTTQMCIERYERLLDAAAEEEAAAAAPAASSSAPGEPPTLAGTRRLRPGEVDPSPETKAARPDPVDMDEEEKEMLAEARARLANTDGKKAKRRARERLLDEARRVAALQKRRELLAAGLGGRARTKLRGMNYNNEVPFERKPAPGLYSTAEELANEAKDLAAYKRSRRGGARSGEPQDAVVTSGTIINGKAVTKSGIEFAARKKELQREAARIEKGFLPGALERKLKEQQAMRRTPLALPSPQVSDAELEQLSKMGYGNDVARLAANECATPASSSLKPSASDHYPMTPLTSLYSARAGGHLLSASLYRSAGAAVTPMHGSATPASSSAYRTPLRDQLGINGTIREAYEPLDAAAISRQRIAGAFQRLPKAKNDFDIILPDEHE